LLLQFTNYQRLLGGFFYFRGYDKVELNKKFLFWLLKATDLRANTSSTAQPVISGGKIYPIEVIVPEQKEQKEIVRRVETLFAMADKIEASYHTLKEKIDQLPQAILAKAFRGELVEGDALEEVGTHKLQTEKLSIAAEP
jgi:type I restriction enzyme S subunit